jgi:uncharacterized SAM-binding protein YcdF (DUF218 family)
VDVGILAVLKAWLLPPGLILLLLLAALGLRRNRHLSMSLLFVSVAVLYGLSTPLLSRVLAGTLERRHSPLTETADVTGLAEAIVVPGCDRYANGPEFGRDVVSACTLVRLRYAVVLHRRTGLPLLLTGGRPMGEPESEAQLMARALQEQFDVTPRWLEQESRNTAENAAFSANLLRAEKIRRVLLVTHAMHMPRAMRSFRRHGITPLDRRPFWFGLLPSGSGLLTSAMACYELLGLAWYTVTGK